MPNLEQDLDPKNDPIYKEMVNELLGRIVLEKKKVPYPTNGMFGSNVEEFGYALGHNQAVDDLEEIKQKLRNDFTK
jgi:hypothetical protein